MSYPRFPGGQSRPYLHPAMVYNQGQRPRHLQQSSFAGAPPHLYPSGPPLPMPWYQGRPSEYGIRPNLTSPPMMRQQTPFPPRNVPPMMRPSSMGMNSGYSAQNAPRMNPGHWPAPRMGGVPGLRAMSPRPGMPNLQTGGHRVGQGTAHAPPPRYGTPQHMGPPRAPGMNSGMNPRKQCAMPSWMIPGMIPAMPPGINHGMTARLPVDRSMNTVQSNGIYPGMPHHSGNANLQKTPHGHGSPHVPSPSSAHESQKIQRTASPRLQGIARSGPSSSEPTLSQSPVPNVTPEHFKDYYLAQLPVHLINAIRVRLDPEGKMGVEVSIGSLGRLLDTSRKDMVVEEKFIPHITSTQKDVIKKLVNYCPNLMPECTFLWKATLDGDVNMARTLLQLGALVDCMDLLTDDDDEFHSNPRVIRKEDETPLIELRDNPQTQIPEGAQIPMSTPLIVAATKGNVELVQLFLDHGANPAQMDGEWCTALGAACMYHKVECVHTLLNHENREDVSKNSLLLTCAVAGDDTAVIQLLLDKGASLPQDEVLSCCLDNPYTINGVQAKVSDATVVFVIEHVTPYDFHKVALWETLRLKRISTARELMTLMYDLENYDGILEVISSMSTRDKSANIQEFFNRCIQTGSFNKLVLHAAKRYLEYGEGCLRAIIEKVKDDLNPLRYEIDVPTSWISDQVEMVRTLLQDEIVKSCPIVWSSSRGPAFQIPENEHLFRMITRYAVTPNVNDKHFALETLKLLKQTNQSRKGNKDTSCAPQDSLLLTEIRDSV